MRIVVVVALVSGLISALPAAADGESCTLKKGLKVTIDGKWESLPAGDAITVTLHESQWSTIGTAKGAARASSGLLESACGLAAVSPDNDRKPDAVVAAPVVEAPVVAPVEVVAAVSAPAAIESAPSGPPRLVAVLDLKPAGVGAEAAAGAFTTMLAAEIAALDGHKAISRNEIKSILSHQADAQLAGCAELRCAADVAQLVNADVLITGQVDKVGGATVISLSLIDAGASDGSEGPAVLSRQEAAFRGPDDQLLLLARPLVQRLFDGANAATHVGNLEIFTEDGAVIIVDGKEMGATPLQPLRELPTGVHTLIVQKGGRVTQTLDIVLARNETTIARVELVEESLFDQPWFWAAAGGVVLVAGGTAAGITTYALLNQETPTRVVLGKPVP